MYCLWTHKFHFSAIFSLKMGPTVLFTYLKIILLQCFSVFSSSFQFSAVSKWTLNLLHPFTQLQKGLLHMSNLFHEYLCEPNGFSFDNFFSKLALFASPSQTSDYVVMAMYGCGRYLAFCRPGDKSWTKIRPIFGASLSVYLRCLL